MKQKRNGSKLVFRPRRRAASTPHLIRPKRSPKTGIRRSTREASLVSTAPIRMPNGQRESADEQIRSLARFPRENPNPILRVTRKGVILYANESCRLLGDERLAKAGRLIPPEWFALVEKGFAGGAKQEKDLTIGLKVFLIAVVPFPDEGYANLYAIDITERRKKEDELLRLNRTLKAISESSQAMMRTGSELDFMEAVCGIIVESCGHAMVWIGMANADEGRTVTPVASFGFDAGYLETLYITWANAERGRGPTGTAIRTGKVSLCRNMLTDPKFEPWRAEAIKRGYAASIALPLADDGHVFGAITIYSREPDPFSEEEVALLAELASDLSYGIGAIRMRAARDGLLGQVEEQRRLAQQSEAVAQRRADELDATFASMSEAVLVYDPDGKIRRANTAAVEILGFDPSTLALKKIAARLSTRHPDGRPLDPADSPTARALRGETVTDERYLLAGSGGREVAVMASAAPLRHGGIISGAVTVMHDVTEREKLLVEMQRRAAELDTIINSIADGVMIHDMDNHVVRLNPAAERIMGYSPKDYGLSLADRTSRATQIETSDGRPVGDPQTMPVPRALRGEITQGVVMGVRQLRTGVFHWVSVSAAPLRTPDGTVFGAVSTLTDMTERMETENELLRVRAELESRVKERTRELEEANSYNRSLIDASLDPQVTITIEGKIGDVNPATEAATGFSREELIGTDFSSYFTDEAKARAGYRRVFSEGKVSDYELEIRHRDGRVTPVLYNASIYTDEALNMKGVIAAARDITRRKKTEAQLRENARRVEVLAEISHLLAEAGPNYHTVMDTIAGLVAQLLGEECLIHLPSAGGQLNLASRHRTAGEEPEPSTSDPSGVLQGLIERVFQAKKPLFLPRVSAEIIRRASGTEALPTLQRAKLSGLLAVPLIVQDSALGTLTVTRSTPGTIYTVEDLALLRSVADRIAVAITNSRLYFDLENALAEEHGMRQHLIDVEKFAAMGRLLGSVAHELNNPLQTIKNCLYLIREDPAVNDKIRSYVHMASDETQRLVDLVAQLRELYRPRSQAPMLPLDLVEILKEAGELMSTQLQNGNVRWSLAGDLPPGVILGARDRLKQVFLNLTTNAIEAMQPAGGTLDVSLRVSEDGRRVGAVFQDSGPGIPPEMIKKLFEPFVTSKNTGLGLGLSICYDIVQKHNGDIEVESPPGQGARFTVWLPLMQ